MDNNAKKRAVHRVRILKGLMDKLENSITKEEYCVGTLNQSLAIQRALKSLDSLLLEQHLDSCVKNNMKKSKKSDDLRKELIALYSLSRKG